MYWVGTSWKMNKSLAEGLAFAKRLATFLPGYDAPVQPFVIPPIPASADYADRRQALIKHVAAARLQAPVPVLYGGSVNPGNAAELIGQPHVDGLFIGRSAWDADGYIDMLRRVADAIRS